MITTWLPALASVIIVSLISLVGVVTLALNESRLRRAIFILVALAAGALFGDAIIHLLPEVYSSAQNPIYASSFVLAGIVSLLILEKVFYWSHNHEIETCHNCAHQHVTPLGKMNLLADGLHNFIDGVAIAASYLISFEIGLATTIAVILHEIPQEIGDFGILLHAGYTKIQALWFNLLSALFAVGGALLVLMIGSQVERLTEILLPIAAGSFLYIAGSDLVPELHKTRDLKKSTLQLAAFVGGIALMYLLLFFEA